MQIQVNFVTPSYGVMRGCYCNICLEELMKITIRKPSVLVPGLQVVIRIQVVQNMYQEGSYEVKIL